MENDELNRKIGKETMDPTYWNGMHSFYECVYEKGGGYG